MVDWVSQSEASRRLGVSKQFFGRKVKAGLFVLNQFKQVDYDRVKLDYVPLAKRPQAALDNPEPQVAKKNSTTDLDYWQARTRRETSEANISEIKQQELKDSLVAKESVRRTVHEVFRSLRDALGVVPRRLSGEVATSSDPEECIDIIDKEIKHVLQSVADEVRRANLE